MECINCQNNNEEKNLFCSQCGSPLKIKRLTVPAVFREFSERYFSFDNKFLNTFVTLFKSPEKVVNGYINGLRVRYVNPITFLVIAVTLSSIQVYLLKNGYIDFNIADIPQDPNSPFDSTKFNEWSLDHQNILMFLSIPFLALISKVVFLDRKEFNFAEHNLIYFYTYSASSIFLLVFVMPVILFFQLNFLIYSSVSYFFYLAYHIYALKSVFNLTKKQIFFKTLLFIPTLGVVFFAFIIIFVIFAFAYLAATGNLNIPK
uniref:DUF3667 domain-containing protein n=1 Tax=Flavobacterium sp. TaxID=239 RepID=UPI00404B0762